MIIQAILRNNNEPALGNVAVTINDPDEDYENNLSFLAQIGATDATMRDCLVERIDSPFQTLKQLEGTPVNYDELDYLARRLDSLDTREAIKFEAAVHLWRLCQIQDFINLTFCCQEATVIDDFHDLKSIGINHYLTVNGGCAPAGEVARQDGEQIALKLIAGGQGLITPYGVIYGNAMRLEPHYTGQNFPPYADRDYLMEIDLSPSPAAPEDSRGAVLFLPMPEKRLERLLERACIYTDAELEVESWCLELPDTMTRFLDVPREGLYDLQRLCGALCSIGQDQWQKLGAVAVFAKPQSANELRQLANNLDRFDFAPNARTAEDYGRYMICESGRFSYDPELESAYNFEKFGQERIEHEEGEFTGQGYVAYHGTLALEELMQGESPGQMRREQQMGGMM